MLNKSLLMLLKEEHRLVLDMKYNRETCEMLKINNNKRLALEYEGKQKELEEGLLECRKEIARYLEFLEVLIDDWKDAKAEHKSWWVDRIKPIH